jgi:catechol 2,3-dioxygenase-like lactoylglutathione lyase family enzyme
VFERYCFVAMTVSDLAPARHFWTEQLGCQITDERDGEFFIVNVDRWFLPDS